MEGIIMTNIKKIHPGVFIKENIDTLGITIDELSRKTGISINTLSNIIESKEDINYDVAYKLSIYFDNSINYWINLQNQYNNYLLEN